MIKLTNLDKFYNKGKLNEIHVIDHTALEFPEIGLVALTGPSGCGKTTLLNVIGGLDKFDTGKVNFDESELTSYKPLEWDILRNKYVGYIFQNYNLITDKTVYQNVEIALNMAGLYDKELVEERINYVLRSVGMYNYRKRNVQALSGGQQQRVAIARAIAKNPKVVLADEPTGNLDANNTFEIMGIIKKISQTCLVILVSHERELVDFYSDRVIELSDGKIINDYDNVGNRTLEHVDDRNIYLQDLNILSGDTPIPVDFYFHNDAPDTPKIKVIYFNNTLFVKVDSKSKVKYITNDSEIQLIDDHYRKPETDDISKATFDLTQFGKIISDQKRKSFIRMKDALKAGFRKVFGERKFLGKLFLLAYFAISALVVYNLATFGALTKVDESEFLSIAKDLIAVEVNEDLTIEDINQLLNETSADNIMSYSDQTLLQISYRDLYQGSSLYYYGNFALASVRGYVVPVSQVTSSFITEGVLPVDKYEIAIDEWLADSILSNKGVSDLGVTSYESLIGGTISSVNVSYPLTVVGIVKTESPLIILTDDNIEYFNEYSGTNYVSLGVATGDYEIVEGIDLVDDGDVLYPNLIAEIGDEITVYGKTFTVVGLYESETLHKPIITNEDFLQFSLENIVAGQTKEYIYYHTDNPSQTILEMDALGFIGINSYEVAKTEYITNMRADIVKQLQNILITFAGIVVYIFFMMRSSMLNRIKEIGIYRSIGASKRDIYKIFISEILAFTTVGSLTGYLFMAYMVNKVQTAMDQFSGMSSELGINMTFFYFPFYLFILGIVAIYAVNLLFGLFPVFSLLRKTPSEINAKYDI
ncbi:MAG: ABC transporter ATP-binding protein/permease [Firmicutes bacterium]|nr:ABC transporter ATP-binding protein/permease [Bacillota bacterium]